MHKDYETLRSVSVLIAKKTAEMAKTTSRALDLLSMLQSHRQWSGAELAERIQVTGRTLRRDVERLRELGYRIDATRGSAGGYRLVAGSRLPPLLLNDDEAVTIAIGLRTAATQGIVDGEQTSLSALAKFEQVLPSGLRERVNALVDYVRPQTSRTEPVSSELLGQLALACRDHERVRFHYVSVNAVESSRRVDPHSLVAADRHWFLVCWDLDRDNWRTFRVDRVSQLLRTGVRFSAHKLPAADAAEFVAGAAASVRKRFAADVIIRLPIESMRERFGVWAKDAVAVDDASTRWPISGESFETMLYSIMWVPAGVQYELRGSPEFLAFAREAAERMRAAVPADS